MADQIRWFAGLDWATKEHRVCLFDADGRKIAERAVKHTGTELAELCSWLLQKTRAPAAQIAVAIETPRGPVVEALLERGFAVFSVNPKQLDRFRDRFTVAGAKDDSRDAHVLGHSLLTDRQAFRQVAVDDPLVIELREWSRMHTEATQERNRLTNRLGQQLWRYYPQACEISDDLAAEWFLDVWEQVPTPAQAARVRENTIAQLLKKHRIRRIDAAEVLRILRRPPLVVAPGTTEAATAHIRALTVRLRIINQQIKEAEHKLDELCAAIEAAAENAPGQICEQRDLAILRSCPGLGRITIATLLGEASEPLRRRDYHVLRTLSGQAPVTRRSGGSCIVLRRHACNNRLRTAMYHWSRSAVQHDPVSKQRYAELRRRGHSDARALRSIGDRLLSVLCTILQKQVLFDCDHKNSQITAAA
jgi:transposase